MQQQKHGITLKWLIIMGLLLNPSVFLGNVSTYQQSHSEETLNEEQADHRRVEMTLNNAYFSSAPVQSSVASSSASSPFFAPHQYGGVDTDFSNDKAFFLTKEGTFFPKATHSKIAFFTQYADFIKARIIGVNDVTGRILRVYQGATFDNLVLEYQTTIQPGQDTFVSIEFNAPATNLYVVFEIFYGNYAEKGWMLEWAYFKNSTTQPYYQFFPQTYYSEIETQFIGGPNTKLDLEIARFNDRYNRLVSLYVDDTVVMSEQATSNGRFTLSNFDIGNFAERTVHNLTIRIRSGSYAEFGWELTKLKIGYTALHVEVDWMEGYEPPMTIFDTISNYFEDNGYERLQFYTNSAPIPLDETLTGVELQSKYNDYSWTKTIYPQNHRYLLFGKYAEGGNLGFSPVVATVANGVYLDFRFKPYSFIAVQKIKDLDKNWKWRWFTNLDENIMQTAMHELGPSLGLLIYTASGEEYYDWGNRDTSVMNLLSYSNSRNSPLYSEFWWAGDGRWWDLRVVMSLPYSEVYKLASEVIV